MKKQLWKIRVDTGGTFTDGWALAPEGGVKQCKVLSNGVVDLKISEVQGERVVEFDGSENYSDRFFEGWRLAGGGVVVKQEGKRLFFSAESQVFSREVNGVELSTGEEAPVVAARLLTGTLLDEAFPEMNFRVATTRGTNALLEEKGVAPVLFVTAGFADLVVIRDQRRPDLFAQCIERAKPITDKVVEVQARLDSAGKEWRTGGEDLVRQRARDYVTAGEKVAVVALLHSDRFPAQEELLRTILLSEGFEEVTISSELGSQIGFLSRLETALANGYLSPIMNRFKKRAAEVGPVDFLTSAGGLLAANEYEPVDSLLSGPAGGLLAARALSHGLVTSPDSVLTFDMGGTSTDVARLSGGIPLRYEQCIGSVRVRRPGVKMETVAAGGGSICRWYQGGLQVGPESAGADPGPACYGRGGPLTVTDVNLLLGYLEQKQVEIPLDVSAARERLDELKALMTAEGAPVSNERELLLGLRAIAIERMAEAVRTVSVREGYSVENDLLIAFGGAGPQHACELAERLGIGRILVPGNAGLLSAWGLHHARRKVHVERQLLASSETLEEGWSSQLIEMLAEGKGSLPESEAIEWMAEVRLVGQAASVECFWAPEEIISLSELLRLFRERYHQLFGYSCPQERAVEIVMIRLVMSERLEEGALDDFVEEDDLVPQDEERLLRSRFCTVLLGSGWKGARNAQGSLLLMKTDESSSVLVKKQPESVRDELLRARLESIVSNMGELLRRTALSTNIKERFDFSCALLDAKGRLILNAPHVPVHLGALGVCVRCVSEGRVWRRGDCVVTNHPGFGGSHLPDVTVVSPVFEQGGSEVIAFVANRAHHAEIGGKAPGSMPGDGRVLSDEGVILSPFLLVEEKKNHLDEFERRLSAARYPSRSPQENLADLQAQVAANQAGISALEALQDEAGGEEVQQVLSALYQRGKESFRKGWSSLRGKRELGQILGEASDQLDDGASITVAMKVSPSGGLKVDFTESSACHEGNLNAPEGVTRSAVLYALRVWLAEDIPLNEGLLDSVEIQAEETFLSPNFEGNEEQCPAVVGGNVETSQRVVELVLRALGVMAESQGTMNNFLFGNDRFGYYETIGGGSGGSQYGAGASGVHVHMTNTAITDPEVLEHRFPVKLHCFSLRRESGGAGASPGGDGLVREFEFCEAMTVSFLTQHRVAGPRGFAGGESGKPGWQGRLLEGQDEGSEPVWEELPGIGSFEVSPKTRIRIETPGGGGFGAFLQR